MILGLRYCIKLETGKPIRVVQKQPMRSSVCRMNKKSLSLCSVSSGGYIWLKQSFISVFVMFFDLLSLSGHLLDVY